MPLTKLDHSTLLTFKEMQFFEEFNQFWTGIKLTQQTE